MWPWLLAGFVAFCAGYLGHGVPWVWLGLLVPTWAACRLLVRNRSAGRYRVLRLAPDGVRWERRHEQPPGMPWAYEAPAYITLGRGKEPLHIPLPYTKRYSCWLLDGEGHPVEPRKPSLEERAKAERWTSSPTALAFLADRSHVRDFLRPPARLGERVKMGLLVGMGIALMFMTYLVYVSLREG